jgi:hypothetical protein
MRTIMSHVPRAIAWRFLSGLVRTNNKPPARAAPDLASERQEAARRVDDRLLTMLQMVNEWLQFAEAKNTGIVALDALGLTGILTYLASGLEIPSPLVAGMLATSLFLVLSLGASLLSFLPQDNLHRIVVKTTLRGSKPRRHNLYFYRDLAAYEPEQLAATVAREYEHIPDYDAAHHRSHVDLASQIIANSQITIDKNAYFRIALLLFLVGLAAALVFTAFAVIVSR